MATSKIKRIEKILNDDGTHSIYNSQHGDFYEFIIEMENGDVGKASAKGEDFKYPIGKEVTYEKRFILQSLATSQTLYLSNPLSQ